MILIVPKANPPVAKIQSFDKFRYQRQKELRKQLRGQKTPELKQIQISVKEAKNDLLIKAKKIENFLSENHKVVIVMVLRGREKSMPDFARTKLEEFLVLISIPYKISQELKRAGRGLNLQIEKQ